MGLFSNLSSITRLKIDCTSNKIETLSFFSSRTFSTKHDYGSSHCAVPNNAKCFERKQNIEINRLPEEHFILRFSSSSSYDGIKTVAEFLFILPVTPQLIPNICGNTLPPFLIVSEGHKMADLLYTSNKHQSGK